MAPDGEAELAHVLVLAFAYLDRQYPWRLDAACREHPELPWFPGRHEPVDACRAVCARCPVATECLAFSMTDVNARRHGVWAGTSAQERRWIRRGAPAA